MVKAKKRMFSVFEGKLVNNAGFKNGSKNTERKRIFYKSLYLLA